MLTVHVQACARLLLEAGQAGRVLGHAGRDIAQLRQETGAIIRVLERHDPDFPTCAGAADGALQVPLTLGSIPPAQTWPLRWHTSSNSSSRLLS